MGRSPVSYPRIPGHFSQQRWPATKLLSSENSPSTEAESAKNRSRRRQDPRPVVPIQYENGAAQGQKTYYPYQVNHNDTSSMKHSLGLAQRRGKGLAPALDLTANATPRQ